MNYKDIIQKQSDFFNSNKTKDIVFRIEQLKKLKSAIRSNEKLLYESVYKDFRKSEFDTYTTELGLIYHDIDEAIRKLPQWAKHKKVATNLINFPARSYVIPEPLGVCLIIGAWNYPYQLSLAPLVAAIASGNTVILKPSESSSAASSAMKKIINENFPSELITVIESGITETTELLKEKFDKIFFTGSVAAGKIVYQAAANHLTPVTLELGGKSPAIVTRSCDLKISAKRLVWAKFLNAGQSCIAPDYILVDESVKEEFLLQLKFYIKNFDYSIENNNYVQIINDRHFDRLIELIDKKKLYAGGETDVQKRFIAPTILDNVDFNDKIMEEEIFGPILPIISYSNINDVISKIKSQPKPLSLYIFTDDKPEQKKILNELSFGGGAVNDAVMHISNSNLPFGGVGNSGTGSYHGEAGFATFSHYKSMLEKPFWLEPNLKYPPNSKKKFALIRWLMGR